MLSLQLEMSDDEALDQSARHPSIIPDPLSCNHGTSTSSKAGANVSNVSQPTNNIAEELDNLMDISMEIASNKRMKKDHIKPFRLTFKDDELEKKVRFLRKTITFTVWVALSISVNPLKDLLFYPFFPPL